MTFKIYLDQKYNDLQHFREITNKKETYFFKNNSSGTYDVFSVGKINWEEPGMLSLRSFIGALLKKIEGDESGVKANIIGGGLSDLNYVNLKSSEINILRGSKLSDQDYNKIKELTNFRKEGEKKVKLVDLSVKVN